ncbi:MAG: ABC transporter permease [Deltaproteobacteria bacterium]|nr:ABC transporter permease [Deltaproteobacteria bacterium]
MRLALRALWRNKSRAMLTALGVIIGVASVIAMVAIGTGTQERIASQFEKMGSHNLIVRPGSITHGGVRSGAGTTTTLSIGDAEAIAELPMVLAAAPSVRSAVQVRYRGANWGTSVEGVTPAYIEVRSWDVVEGAFFTEREIADAAHVCVLGQTVARELFGLAKPVGETVIIKGLACRVVGVLGEKGASAWGWDLDDMILMPITTVQRKIRGIRHIERIEVQAMSRDAAFRAAKALQALLRERHRLQDDQPDDFRHYNRAEWAESAEESARILTWLLGSIASVSLLVGGIGIMNIMLVSVTERTREIGIRMALGGRRRDILWQFLLEAMVLSGAGGLLGIAMGIGGAVALGRMSEFSVTITSWSIVVAFSFSALVGVFFGFQPARRASRLRPIEALRYE